MGNLAKAFFDLNGSWTAPAGVTNVTVVTQNTLPSPVYSTGTSTQALNSYGTPYGWGSNTNGQQGNGTTNTSNSPVLMVGGYTFSQIISAPSINSVFGLTPTGQLYAWGTNTNGQLGIGNVTNQSSPTLVLGGITWSSVYVDDDFSGVSVFGIASNGNGYAWGFNTSGKLGVGDSTDRSSPVAIVGGHTWSKFFSDNNDDFIIALDTTGTAYGWGANGSGWLGDGTTTSRNSPVLVVGGHKFKQITMFESGTVGITDDGTAWGWGGNQSGNLGVGSVLAKSSPTLVLGGLKFSKIAGGSSMIGLTTAGAAYCWGSNSNGQLGTNDLNPRSSPVAVLGGLTFTDISHITTTTMYGLTSAGALYSWGNNQDGLLGDATTVAGRSSPVAVVGGITFAAAPNPSASIQSNIFAYSTTGQLYGWGTNNAGQIGDGTTTKKSSPVLVAGGFIASHIPSTVTTQIAVVPNTAYTINLQQPNPTFGSTVIGNASIPSSITVYFEE